MKVYIICSIYGTAGGRFIAIASGFNIRCRARCPSGGTVIWCVNTYHPVKNIEACFSVDGLVNATDAALSLNIPNFFEVLVSSVSNSFYGICGYGLATLLYALYFFLYEFKGI